MVRAFAALLIGLVMIAGAVSPAWAAVKATVNGIPVTDVQVNQRVQLLKLEPGNKGASAALDELINEQLMLAEARRLGIEVTERQVDDAFLNVARGINASAENLRKILTANAVNVDTLRDRLRALVAWQGVTQIALIPRVQISDAELEQKAQDNIDPSLEFDYILSEVLFILPGGKGNASQRAAQAEQFRKSFQNCENAVQLSLAYTDAAVKPARRWHATQLPEPIAKELSRLNVGGITKPRVVEGGVSMFAVCSKSAAEDTSFIKNNLRQEAGNEALKAEQDAYLAELRGKAKIIYE